MNKLWFGNRNTDWCVPSHQQMWYMCQWQTQLKHCYIFEIFFSKIYEYNFHPLKCTSLATVTGDAKKVSLVISFLIVKITLSYPYYENSCTYLPLPMWIEWIFLENKTQMSVEFLLCLILLRNNLAIIFICVSLRWSCALLCQAFLTLINANIKIVYKIVCVCWFHFVCLIKWWHGIICNFE